MRVRQQKQKLSFFGRLCKCFSNRVANDMNQSDQHNSVDQQFQNNQLRNQNEMGRSVQGQESIVTIGQDKQLQIEKLKVISNIDDKTIKFSQTKPVGILSQMYPYSCPICLKYYNKILKLSCCKNYVCYYCVQQIEQQMLAGKLERKCWWCRQPQFYISDVDPNDQVRVYSDAYFSSKDMSNFKSNFSRQQANDQEETVTHDQKITDFINTVKSLNLEQFRVENPQNRPENQQNPNQNQSQVDDPNLQQQYQQQEQIEPKDQLELSQKESVVDVFKGQESASHNQASIQRAFTIESQEKVQNEKDIQNLDSQMNQVEEEEKIKAHQRDQNHLRDQEDYDKVIKESLSECEASNDYTKPTDQKNKGFNKTMPHYKNEFAQQDEQEKNHNYLVQTQQINVKVVVSENNQESDSLESRLQQIIQNKSSNPN